MILTLVPVVLQLIQMFFPTNSTVTTISNDVATVLPNLVSAAQTELTLFQSGTLPTAAQQTSIDAALDQANTLLQNAQPGVA